MRSGALLSLDGQLAQKRLQSYINSPSRRCAVVLFSRESARVIAGRGGRERAKKSANSRIRELTDAWSVYVGVCVCVRVCVCVCVVVLFQGRAREKDSSS